MFNTKNSIKQLNINETFGFSHSEILEQTVNLCQVQSTAGSLWSDKEGCFTKPMNTRHTLSSLRNIFKFKDKQRKPSFLLSS